MLNSLFKLKPKKMLFLSALLITIIAFIFTEIASANNLILSKKINTYMKTYDHSFSGTVLVSKDGKLIFEKGYGMANIGQHIPNTINTEFRIASITKQFTAMAILQLQQKGLLNVNDKLSKYLPQYQKWGNITIKELLTHTSGIPDWTSFEDEDTDRAVENILDGIKTKPLNFTSGTKWQYSNTNYLILGDLVERLSGLSYDDYIKKNILLPLHMDHTGMYTEQSGKDVALGYPIIDDDGPTQPLYAYGGDGGLYSTVQDLYKWDRSLYTNKLVSSQSLKQMFSPQANTGSLGLSYGYGWFVKGTGLNEEIYHNGSLPGYLSSIVRYPQKDISIIVLSNNSSSSSAINHIVNGLEDLALK